MTAPDHPTPNAAFYDTIARYYEAENATFTEDIALYHALAEETDGSILVVGCGAGRVLLPLADHNRPVTGLDRSAPMLARARRHLEARPALAPWVTILEGDALTADLGGPYGLIIVPYNTLMHFTEQEAQLRLLARLRAVLQDEGLLVIDLPNAGEQYNSQDDSSVILERSFLEPESGHIVMQQSVSSIDRAEQRLSITWIYDELGDDGTVRRTLAPLELRYVFPGEIELMLRLAGLSLLELYGDHFREPFVDGCPHMIVVAEPAQEPAP